MSVLLPLVEATIAVVLQEVAGMLATQGVLDYRVSWPPGSFAVVDTSGAHPADELRRVVGVGVSTVPSDQQLEECLRAASLPARVDVLSPSAGGRIVSHLLTARGYAPDRSFLILHQPLHPHPTAAEKNIGEVQVRRMAEPDHRLVEAIYDAAFGCRHGVRLDGLPDWTLFVAEQDAHVVAAAACFRYGPLAWLGWAATDPAARRRGAHTALLAARLDYAARLGLVHAAIEVPDPDGFWGSTTSTEREIADTARRNAERAGFIPLATRTSWVRAIPSPPAAHAPR